jgi:hypothetical protein
MTRTDAQGNPVLTPQEMFDLHPATFGGAQEGARRVTAEMSDPNALIISRDGTKEPCQNKLNISNAYPRLNTVIPLAMKLILLQGDSTERLITDLDFSLVLMLI